MHAINHSIQKINPVNNHLTVLKPEKKRNTALRKIAVSTTEGIEIFNIADITHCEAKGSYCQIQSRDGRSILASKTLKCVETAIQSSRFIRVHQSFLVCLHDIQSILPDHIMLGNGSRIPVSRAKRPLLMARINELLTYV